MKLVGATNMFVRLPYLIEGILYGLIASIISTAVLYPMLYYLSPRINSFLGEVGTDTFSYFVNNLPVIFGVQLLFGVFLGIISSYIAIRKYLKA